MSARTAQDAKDRAVEAEGERLSSLLFVPMKNNGSAFGRFCVSNQDSADKVASQTLQFAAGLCQTELTGADGSKFKEWMSSGMRSVRSHWVGRNPTGLYIVEVKDKHLQLLRTNIGVSHGLCAMEDLEAPQWFVVLPRQCDLRVEIERLLLCLPPSRARASRARAAGVLLFSFSGIC